MNIDKLIKTAEYLNINIKYLPKLDFLCEEDLQLVYDIILSGVIKEHIIETFYDTKHMKLNKYFSFTADIVSYIHNKEKEDQL